MKAEPTTDRTEDIARQLERRRAAAAASWNLGEEVVLIGAGEPVSVPGRYDLTYPFRAHSEYFYATDRERPGGVLAFDPREGWVEFLRPVTRDELLWTGTDEQEEGVPAGTRSRTDLPAWLAERAGRPCAVLGAPVSEAASDPQLEEELRYLLTAVRRAKDEVELARMAVAEEATRAGHLAARELVAPGRTERALQIELEAELFRQGADALAFETVVAGGPHSAVLHFAPTTRALASGELVLIDAGGEHRGYAGDVTRTYPVSGEFSPEQRQLYDLVRRALDVAVAACRPGAEWRDVHRAAALELGAGLVDLQLLRGDPESLFAQGAITLFFPHGIGHMVGLGVRDAGGVLRDREPPGPGFPSLRVDLPLQVGYTMTVEPGLYFVPRLLRDPETRRSLGQAADWDRIERLASFGGIRLEENVLVTSTGCDVLTERVPLL
jgi:Xaa-Pro aminopeptidase